MFCALVPDPEAKIAIFFMVFQKKGLKYDIKNQKVINLQTQKKHNFFKKNSSELIFLFDNFKELHFFAQLKKSKVLINHIIIN